MEHLTSDPLAPLISIPTERSRKCREQLLRGAQRRPKPHRPQQAASCAGPIANLNRSGAAVAHHGELQILDGLRQDGLDGATKQVWPVVRRDYDAE